MSQPQTITGFALAAAVANNIALSQTLGAAGPVALNGAVGSGALDRQRRIIITSAGNDTAVLFTITGTNDSGAAISEVLAGANIGAAASLRDYKSVTSIVSSAATSAITVGTNGVGSSRWIKLDNNLTGFFVSVADVLVSGAINDTIEYTLDNVDDTSIIPAAFPVNTALTAFTTTKDGILGRADAGSSGGAPAAAVRLTRNSGTGTSRFVVRQQGLT